jgi:molybdenum cofactor biosynthesis enzyme MoaA
MKEPSHIITGRKKALTEFRIRLTILALAINHYRNLTKVYTVLRSLDSLRRSLLGPHRIKKLALAGGKYYWDMYTPGYPSKQFDEAMLAEMNRIIPFGGRANRFSNVFLSITKKCTLKCEHCFEWNALNRQEQLSLADIRKMVHQFQSMGTGQIQLAGAEPMMRVGEIAQILEGTSHKSEFWILTSGINLTPENAVMLKRNGLVGVVVSLDHHDRNQHNTFRGNKRSFEWVERAVQNSLKAGLVTALSVCATREFVTHSNLHKYISLARAFGVSFVQILEPRAVGHYEGCDVSLSKEQERLLETFMQSVNFGPSHSDYPIVSYHGYHQRRIGCFASGNRNLYVDTDGDIHACPFCQKKTGSALSPDVDQAIANLQTAGCHSFKSSDH